MLVLISYEMRQGCHTDMGANISSLFRKIYENLSTLVSNSGDQSSLADVYQQRCQEMTPQLRYCAFSVGDESAGTVDDLIRMKTEMQTGGEQQENLLITSDLDVRALFILPTHHAYGFILFFRNS